MNKEEFDEIQNNLNKYLDKRANNAKREYIKGVQTRLRPNTFDPDEKVWETLRSGLWKMNISELMALEILIVGKTKRLEEWIPGL